MFNKHRTTLILIVLALLALPLLAQAQDTPATTIELVGAVEAFDDATLTVNGQVIDMTGAEVNVTLEVGLVVEVEGVLQADGSIVATEVKASKSLPGEIEIVGLLTSLDGTAAVVAGMTFDVTGAEIGDGVAVDQLVKVHATLSETGTWVASEIELADEPAPAATPEPGTDDNDNTNDLELTGTLEEVGDTFIVVTGLTIDISSAEIHDPLVVGTLVKVHAEIVDGALVATEVENASASQGQDTGSEDASADTCTAGQPSGWTTYVVQPGDTLESLSAILGIDASDLAEANCLDESADLVPGTTLYGPVAGQSDGSVDDSNDSSVSDDHGGEQGDDSSGHSDSSDDSGSDHGGDSSNDGQDD